MGFELSGYNVKKCRGRAAFLFQPKKRKTIDLEKLSRELEEKGAFINALTPLLLVVKFQNTLLTFYQNGKAIVKEESERKAIKVLERLAE